MEINRNNYEAYFIDYLEGNLDEKLVDTFIAFIQSNPDLKEELALFEAVSAVPENIEFSKKNKLYKEKFDSEKEFDNAAVAILEEDFSEEERIEFEMYLAEHPEKKKEAALFIKTKLQADESVVFGKKNKLYRKPLGKTILLWSTRVAAVLVFALAIFVLFDKPSNKIIRENTVAELKEKTPEKETTTEVQAALAEEKETPGEKKENSEPNPVVLKPIKKKKTTEIFRENSIQNVEDEYLTLARIPLEIPSELNAISASLTIEKTKATMAVMYLQYPENTNIYDEKLLVDVVKEKTGFSFNKISKAGLNLVANISQERFSYETTEEGRVKEYKYDSRLLAFSIPNKKVQPE